MRNKIGILLTSFILLAAVLGCSSIADKLSGSNNLNSNKTLTDKAVDTTVGEGTTGVPECDEVLSLLTQYAENPDDSFVVKAGKAFFVNKMKESIKKSIEENKSDRTEVAKNCKNAKVQLEKYKAEEEKKKAK